MRPLEDNSLGLLQKLYDLLLRPASHVLDACEHLVVVPYGMLHYLPFHCLFDGAQFVVERLNVSYLSAAALWEICYQRGHRIETKRASLSDSLVLGISDNGRLQFAVQEAEVVAKQLGTRPMLDNDATASLLWQYGARSPIVHIAAHGLLRLDAPNFSHIKLAANIPLCIGSDSNTRLAPIEELRWAEYSARIRYQRRRILVGDELSSPGALLLDYGTHLGATALGLHTGVILPGMPADFIGVDLNHPAMAGWNVDDFLGVLFFGASFDVITQTWVGGRVVTTPHG